ncbi:MAG: hypothetical protein PQJ58_11780 [Spirochaetales bacterium]|nr:hypothetical protein [Spirochaetales bacterium]
MTSNILEKAIAIAVKAHQGQTDKAGQAYILHPLQVMHNVISDEQKAGAVLHDVVEDTDLTPDDLRAQGMPKKVISIVESLTNREGEDYDQFIDRVLHNPDAVQVKIADIEDNMDLTRLESLRDKDLQRIRKYHGALKRLKKSLPGLV